MLCCVSVVVGMSAVVAWFGGVGLVVGIVVMGGLELGVVLAWASYQPLWFVLCPICCYMLYVSHVSQVF